MWNQSVRYDVRFCMLASLHIVYFCERSGTGMLLVDGPHYRPSLPDTPSLGPLLSTTEIMAFWARALEVGRLSASSYVR